MNKKMKKILFFATAALLFASCQESLEERAAREARDFTRKNWPRKLAEAVTTDSMVFESSTLTLHYYMSVRGQADTTAILKDQLRKDMVESLKGNTGLKNYKEAGYNFKYTYSSTKHKGMVLFETTIAKKDYGS